MAVFVELDDLLADRLHQYCEQKKLSETELLNRLVGNFLARVEQPAETPSQLWQRIFSQASRHFSRDPK